MPPHSLAGQAAQERVCKAEADALSRALRRLLFPTEAASIPTVMWNQWLVDVF